MKQRPEQKMSVWHLILLLSMCLFPILTHAGKPVAVINPGSTGSVLDSPHDLAVHGPGAIKAKSENDACIFCHAPHQAAPSTKNGTEPQEPLWNHHSSKATYIPYTSTTMIAKVGQPNGTSKLCLSCHDGTVALGMVNTGTSGIVMQNGVTVMKSGSNNLGTDLSQDHPISFTYDAALAAKQGRLCNPSALTGKVRLDSNNQMQCTACHDPHNNQFGNFLVMNNANSALCTTCHTDALWEGSAHHLSSAPLKQAASELAVRPVSMTVGGNGCNNCHASHAAGGRQRLLITAREDQTCYTCHNGSVVRQNIEAEFNKLSVHPILQSAEPSEAGRTFIGAARQVTCSDCHNPHAAKAAVEAAPRASGAILGVQGVTSSGAIISSVMNEYELCFRCHGDAAVRTEANVSRLVPQTNLRLAFNPGNASYHPVVGVGKGARVPSLLPPYTTGMLIKCTDCHNNDKGPGAGGTGPRGPHGSEYAPLLERQLITVDYMGESDANYALCYKCHNRESILSDQSFRAFNNIGQDRGHQFHIVQEKAACTTCHDSHGVATNKHLINFNPEYVTPASNGRIEYTSTGPFRGNCTLTCHGYDHLNAAYPELILSPPALRAAISPRAKR